MLLAIQYKRQLAELSHFLLAIGEYRWSSRVAGWLEEFNNIHPKSTAAKKHVARTRAAIASTRSLGGIVITRRKGLNKTLSEGELRFLSTKLAELISGLYWTACATQECA